MSKPGKQSTGLAEIVVRRPLAVIMVYLAVTLFGVYALTILPIDQLPKIEVPAVTILTVYPGAGPSDVEKKVTDIIERAVSTTSGLKDLRSKSRENLSIVVCEFEQGTDLEAVVEELRQHLEFAKSHLPQDARKPMIFKFNTSMFPVYILGVRNARGDIRPYRRVIMEKVAEKLERLSGVGSVLLLNAPKKRVVVEVRRRDLDARGISLLRLVQVLKRANFSVPGGRMTWKGQDLPVQVPGDFESLSDIAETPIGFSVVPPYAGALRTSLQEPYSDELALVRLKDVADVHWELPERASYAQQDGKNTTWVMVFRKSGENTVEVANRVLAAIPKIQRNLPGELNLVPILDASEDIRQTVNNLSDTVIIGGILVVVVVLLFLRRLRTSLVVALTIPASMVASFLGIYLMGYTINSVSLLALALGIGMVVDNAIVVLESITNRVEQGTEPHEAAVGGTREVGLAISASTLTTVVIFAPLVFVRGFIGIIFGQLAFVVALTLFASLVTALVLTPTLTARLLHRRIRPDDDRAHPLLWLYERSESLLTRFEGAYGRLVALALRHRPAVILVALALAGGSAFLALRTGVDFVIKDDQGFIQITVEMPEGTPLHRTVEVADAVAQTLRKQKEVRHTFSSAGTTETAMMSMIGGKEGPNIAQVYAKLIPKAKRRRSEDDVADAILPALKKRFPDAVFSVRTGNPLGQALTGTGKPIVVMVKGKNIEDIRSAARDIASALSSIPGTKNVSTELMATRPQLRVQVNRRRASRSALSSLLIGATVRTALYGTRVGAYHASDRNVDIVLRLRKQDRQTPKDIEALKITTGLPLLGAPLVGAAGPTMLIGLGAERMVPLAAVAQVVKERAPVEIEHIDKQRMVMVTANYAGRALGDIVSDLGRRLETLHLPKGIFYSFGGEVKRQKQTLHDLTLVLIMGVLLVYMVMAAQFESLVTPFVIMFSIPFAFTGVFLGFALAGTKLSLPAFLGLVVLMGIVVNNAIVLLDYAEQLIADGMGTKEALVAAGKRRLRPVLMTTTTTIFGMLPLAVSHKPGSYVWAPLGQAVASGLAVSTLVTLILVPVVYSLLHWMKKSGSKAQQPRSYRPESSPTDMDPRRDAAERPQS